ncbi:MAG: cellulase family glycosylhydrolase [Dactylosporangium sp.]|nr:cellulase family glycosylhydrolase [Dactylosporangium sp.]NNJ62226.1 cellulase family glycosylhydrolase [Dactylosporangium sp.]
MAAIAVATAATAVAAARLAEAETTASTLATTEVPATDWLHTEGNKIVDGAGNPVWLTGANWFGFNASERVFHGLWSGNINEITMGMADRGINIVRVPISTELLLEWKAGTFATVNVNTYVNPELTGMNSLEIFDYWLELCEQYGLKVLLDVHSAEADNSGHVAPMWYRDSITPELFYQGWEWIAARYQDNDTIVAFDLENEPHGKVAENPRAKWDASTDVDNWKHAAQTAAQRILAINPNVLVLVEGIEIYPRSGASWSSTVESDYHFNWWGGNLRGVADHPIDLGANADQLVYSPHDYGPLVWEQPWFAGSFDKTTLTDDVWRPNWLYIHEGGTAPLLIGEWGGRLGQDDRQDQWMTALRDLIAEYGLHQTFWCLNPNSGDTGGLLLDDWVTWDEEKYELLKGALWQYDGMFVGLDHQVPLGGVGSTTGISLAGRYSGGGEEGDLTAPTAPGQPTASDVTAASATLTWTAATDNVGVSAYDVLQATGTAAATVVATVSGTSFTATGLTGDTTYAFSVRARDAAGNVSEPSPAVTLTTLAGGGNDGCLATYKVTNSWSGGFMGEVIVANTSTAALNGWTVTWVSPAGTTIDSLWNGTMTVSGSTITVQNDSHNGAVPVDATTTFGFVGSGASTGPDVIGCTAS